MSLVRESYRYLKRMTHILQGTEVCQRVQVKQSSVLLGNSRACWRISTSELSRDTIVYSIGVGEDISFELELIRRFGVRVYAFDPTPRSIKWLEGQVVPEQFSFYPYGLAEYDGNCAFHPPANPSFVSHTILSRQGAGTTAVELPVHRLPTIMQMLKHERVDVLKMDIEGAEYGVLKDILQSGIRPGQLLAEFHHRWPEIGIEKTRHAISELNSLGYKIFTISSSGEEYGFLNCGASPRAGGTVGL
jgi:FkbM family methyltransferase